MATRDIDLDRLTCPGCEEPFAFGPGERDLAAREIASVIAQQAYGDPLPLSCVRCGTKSVLDMFSRKATRRADRSFKCPLSGCAGYVSRVDAVPVDHVGPDARTVEGPVSLCGDCGSLWKRRESLEQEIRRSLVAFPHRTVFYDVAPGDILPAVAAPDGDVFEEIENEPQDGAGGFVRD